MTVQRPRYFGWEGYLLVSDGLFAPDANGNVPEAQILLWLGAAIPSNEVTYVRVQSSRETVELTTRRQARRGYRHFYQLAKNLRLQFEVHERGPGLNLFSACYDAWRFSRENHPNNQGLLAIAALTSQVGDPQRRGVIGNFDINMSKSEELRRLQTWTVTATPTTYVNVWVEQ